MATAKQQFCEILRKIIKVGLIARQAELIAKTNASAAHKSMEEWTLIDFTPQLSFHDQCDGFDLQLTNPHLASAVCREEEFRLSQAADLTLPSDLMQFIRERMDLETFGGNVHSLQIQCQFTLFDGMFLLNSFLPEHLTAIDVQGFDDFRLRNSYHDLVRDLDAANQAVTRFVSRVEGMEFFSRPPELSLEAKALLLCILHFSDPTFDRHILMFEIDGNLAKLAEAVNKRHQSPST